MTKPVPVGGAAIQPKGRVDLGEMYWRFVRYLDASPRTIDTYSGGLRRFFSYLAENDIPQPQREDVIAWREGLKESLKSTTVQAYITAVRLFFRWLEQEKIYPNIAEHIKGAKISRDHKRDELTADQMKAALSAIDRDSLAGLRDYAIIALLATGGLRTIEIVRANVADLTTKGGRPVLYVQGKGRQDKAEYVNVSRKLEAAIKAYMKAAGISAHDSPLFISLSNNSRGKRITTRGIRAMVKARLAAVGIQSERLTAHSFRHGAITGLYRKGLDIVSIQQFARHKNIGTTQVYIHEAELAENRGADVLADAIL